MINQEQRQLIKQVVNILLRRKIIIFICMLLAIVVGLGYYLKAPKVYRASSLIMYQQKINPTEMSPDMGRFGEIVSTVSQQITSRSSLENLITQFNLYPGLRARLPMEDVVDIMRKKDVRVNPSRTGNIFTVSYTGPQPRTVLLVANALAAKFIEENIRLREETVSETSSYIKDELNMAKNALNKKEAAMREYKLKYYNEMPDQREPNISRLNGLQIQYQTSQNTLQELERTKVLIQEQIAIRQEMLSQMTGGVPVGNNAAQIVQLQAELDVLLSRYTEKHPDVRRIKSLIANLQEDAKSDTKTETEGNEQDVATAADAEQVATAEAVEEQNPANMDPQLYKLQKQLEAVDYEIEKLHKERERTQQQIERYMEWIEAAPMREAEWTDLTRDYQQFSKHYSDLVARNIQADAAESLERRQKGSQFKIIDPANFPAKPFSPDFIQIMLAALGIGLAAGAVLGLGLELLDTSFRDAHDLEKFLDLPVACAIPVIRTEKEQRKERLKSTIWFFTLFLSFSVLCGSIAFLWYKGVVII